MAPFYFFKVPHTFDVLLLSSLVLHLSGLLNLLLERLMTLVDQARNFDFANLLHRMKNVTGTWWLDIISTADLRHSKLNTTITILKNTLRSVFRRRCFFFFAFKREVRKNVFCLLASFDVSFHHSSRFGSTQIQSKKEPCGACPGMLMRPNVLITFPCIT